MTVEQMRADLVLMKQFGFNAVRTSHCPERSRASTTSATSSVSTWSTRRTSRRTRSSSRLCDDPRYAARVGRPRQPHGAARQEPSVHHPVVARQRVRLRRRARRAGRRGSAATTRPGRCTTRARSCRDWSRAQRPPTCSARCTRRSPTSWRGPSAADAPELPADPVRVLARDGQQQRLPRRLLGRDRAPRRAAGRVHLGVLGPRAAPDAARRHDAATPTAATSATSRTT